MRQYLDKQDTIDQIRLDSYHPSNRHSVWILVEGEIANTHDLLKLCNGHDAIQIFKLYTNHQRSHSPHKSHKTGINDHEFSRTLQAAYRWSDFCLTQLCRQLQDWAKHNGRTLFNPKFQV